MITSQKYFIPDFNDFSLGHNFKLRNDLKHASNTARLYYEFAFHQMEGFRLNNATFFKEKPDSHNEIITYLRKGWSEAYAVYALLRTVIEAVRKLNKAFQINNKIDPFFSKEIKRIVDITNDIVKHPMFNDATNPLDASHAYTPISLYETGEIDIERWIDEKTAAGVIKIDLFKDFEIIHDYLEHVANLY